MASSMWLDPKLQLQWLYTGDSPSVDVAKHQRSHTLLPRFRCTARHCLGRCEGALQAGARAQAQEYDGETDRRSFYRRTDLS